MGLGGVSTSGRAWSSRALRAVHLGPQVKTHPLGSSVPLPKKGKGSAFLCKAATIGFVPMLLCGLKTLKKGLSARKMKGLLVRRQGPPLFGLRQRVHSSSSTPPGSEKSSENSFTGAWEACNETERKQLGLVFGFGAVLNVGLAALIPTLPVLCQELGLGASGLGLLLATPSLSKIILNLPAAAATDSVGRVPAMVLGEGARALGALGTACGGSLGVLLPIRCVLGAGEALSAAGGTAYVADVTARRNVLPYRGILLGIQGSLVSAAFVVGPLIGGAVSDSCGPRFSLTLIAGLTSVCAAAYSRLPETLQLKDSQSKGKLTLSSVLPMLKRTASEWQELAQDRNQLGLLAAQLAMQVNYAATACILPVLAQHCFQANASDVGLICSVGAIVGVLLRPMAGVLSDQGGRVRLVVPAALLCAGGLVSLSSVSSKLGFIAAFLLWNAGEAILAPTLAAYAADIAPRDKAGAALALSRQAGDIIMLLAPPGLGLLFDLCSGQVAMGFAAALTTLCALVFRRLAREAR